MDAGQSPLADSVYVERLTEPYSGMALVGVGGFVPVAEGVRVEVLYDDETAVVLTPTSHPDGRLHFATQLPVEAGVATLTVLVRVGEECRTLYEGHIDQIGERIAASESQVNRFGVLGRGVRSVVTGEVVSPARWLARIERMRAFALSARQKVRYKLLARRHRSRSTHDAYIAGTAIDRAALKAVAETFRYRPTISILVPVYDVEPRWLDAAIRSVREQVYDRWELCLADDASTHPKLLRYLSKLPDDPRIKLVRRPVNGHISAASNSAADLATGEFIALLDNDDAIAPDALFEIASLLQSHPDADLIYSDEDKTDAEDRRFGPQFKPTWSPELLLSYNYVNHFTCIRRRVFEQAGRFRVGYEGSQDQDLLLRVTELTDRIHHIPKVLYHWRALPSSTATAAGVKTYMHTSGRKAVQDALTRRGMVGTLATPPFAERLGIPVLELVGTETPMTAVIVYGSAVDAATTVRAVAAPGVTTYLVLDPPNLADALNRLAAARTETNLVFVKAGTVPADADWVRKLSVHLARPEIGAAGGLIRGPAGEVVSAGTVLGMRDGLAPGNACHGLPAAEISYYFYAEVTRNVTAPANGVLATTRVAFDRVGGFDAERYPRTTFDIDYCLRLAGLGLRTVQVGGAEFLSESTADRADDPAELKSLMAARGRLVDPYYNANLCDASSFRPLAVSRLPAMPGRPLSAVVAAHNLNNPEGAPRYLSEIALGLARRNAIAPTVWSPTDGAGADVYRSAGIDVKVAAAEWSGRFIDGRWTRREYEDAQRHLMASFREQRPDVVIANTLLTFPVIEAAARVGVPTVWIIHESYSAEHLARLFPPFAQHRIELAFAVASRVVPASHATAKLFERLDTRGNLQVLHNGLNTAPFDRYIRRVSKTDAVERIGGTPGKKRLVCVGTVCERKGQHTLIEAAAKLAATRDDFECDIVGVRDEVPYAKYVRELVRRRGLEKVVRLIDETDDVWAYYRAADVYVCTSHMETFSRSMLEAEAFGLPVVSTDCCGVSEQVFWDFNALRFAAGDADALAGQLELVLADDARRAGMATRSRAAFDLHLTEAEMLDRYESVIRTAAGRLGHTVTEVPAVRKAA